MVITFDSSEQFKWPQVPSGWYEHLITTSSEIRVQLKIQKLKKIDHNYFTFPTTLDLHRHADSKTSLSQMRTEDQNFSLACKPVCTCRMYMCRRITKISDVKKLLLKLTDSLHIGLNSQIFPSLDRSVLNPAGHLPPQSGAVSSQRQIPSKCWSFTG